MKRPYPRFVARPFGLGGRAPALACLAILLLPGVIAAHAASFPDRPPPGRFSVDEARLLRAAEAREIDEIAEALLRERGIPILVVTLRSLASRGAAGYTIERYATELFNHWGIGSPDHDLGMLLLVAIEDRRARIELGAGWPPAADEAARQVMGTLIVPEFKGERYAEGILAGVRGLNSMARHQPLPRLREWWHLPVAGAVFLGVSGFVVSFLLGGREGWAWGVLALAGALALLLLSAQPLTTPRLRSGGSPGGAFRGGSSRGGGVTGRW